MSTREIAKQLKLDPKRLRAVLRTIGKGSGGKNYQLTAADVAAVKKHIAAEEPAKKAKKK